MPNFREIRRRHELKSTTISAFGATWYDSGSGRQPWPSLAQRDWSAVAGPLGDHPTIAIALAWIRRNACQGRICVGKEVAGKYEEIPKHPLVQMLRRPNPWDSWRATLGGTTDCLGVDGNAYWLKSRDGFDETGEITWAPNHTISVDPELDPLLIEKTGPVKGYWFSCGGIRRWYKPSEVVHFRNGRDPLCRYMGISELKRQLRNAGSITAAERYTGAILLNAHSGKIISPKEGGNYDPDPKEMESAAAAIRRSNTQEGAGSVGKVYFPIDMNDVGMGPESMMLDRIVDRPEAYILAALGTNAMTLNMPSSKDLATYANKGEARRESWENGVIPIQDLIADEIEQQLLPDFEDTDGETIFSVWWDRKDVAALREDATERATRSVSLYQGSISTLNEARESVDLPPVDGGDASPLEAAQQAHEQQMEVSQSQADANPDEPQDPNAAVDDDPNEEDATDKKGDREFIGESPEQRHSVTAVTDFADVDDGLDSGIDQTGEIVGVVDLGFPEADGPDPLPEQNGIATDVTGDVPGE